jgi:hypothetical protein
MSQALSRAFSMLVVGAGALILGAGAAAQPKETKETISKGAATVKKEHLKGEIVSVGARSIVVKMIPGGDSRVFTVAPDKTFTIDGVPKSLKELQNGTVLDAEVTITETPVIERTTTITNGKVVWASPTSLIVTLDNGENKQYAVKPDFKFDVNGEKVSAMQLRRGMHLTGTKVVEEPTISITRDAVVTGTAPKAPK